MTDTIKPISLEDLERLETLVKRHRSVGILRAANELGWAASPRIQVPRRGRAFTQSLDWVEPGVSTSVDFPTSTESLLLPAVTGLAIDGLQEILIDRVATWAFKIWLGLPENLQTGDALIDICISFISRKTLHELCHALGNCNEKAAVNAETLIPIEANVEAR